MTNARPHLERAVTTGRVVREFGESAVDRFARRLRIAREI
jgi:hypothetical protein